MKPKSNSGKSVPCDVCRSQHDAPIQEGCIRLAGGGSYVWLCETHAPLDAVIAENKRRGINTTNAVRVVTDAVKAKASAEGFGDRPQEPTFLMLVAELGACEYRERTAFKDIEIGVPRKDLWQLVFETNAAFEKAFHADPDREVAKR